MKKINTVVPSICLQVLDTVYRSCNFYMLHNASMSIQCKIYEPNGQIEMAGKCSCKHLPWESYSDGFQKCYKAANMLNSPPVAAASHGAIWSLVIWSWGQHLCDCWLPVLRAGIWDIPICSPVSHDFNNISEQRVSILAQTFEKVVTNPPISSIFLS